MDFATIVKSRYAARSFDGRKIPEVKVQELLELIRFAPSSFNIQPWFVKIVTDQALKDKLAPAAWNQPQVTTCSHLFIFCANTDILGNIKKLEEVMLGNGAQPDKIKGYVDMMRGFAEGLSEDSRRSWAQKQTYIALGNALNGAKALGFDACPMEGFSAEEFAKILELPKHLVPSVLCPIGYAIDAAKPKVRLSMADISSQ
ncbi:MAG: NAD(P)H-dependent oxidoreductase [Nanoarchaeota archaeon]|nr:NAD(P)H-dependent oxidoreductase [Nanoarchaeota archaeon]